MACQAWAAELQQPTPSTDSAAQVAFFESRVRPLLVDRCFECHNDDVQESNLRLDSLQAMLDGGDRGPAIIPGDPNNSLLMHAVNHSEADLQMPEGDKLQAHEIKMLAQWIQDGAFWPGQQAVRRATSSNGGSLFNEADRSFWAFVRPSAPALPTVQDEAWIQSEIDRFVLARLESNGLKPAPPASKQTLLRRTYFDLIGLPPSPEVMEAFLQDESAEAYSRVVERLLASPQYGERWGRHWLDVARYADSNGMDENWAFEFIYRYRDWVVDALNQDMPYDQFVTYQIAGDLIERQADESVADYVSRVAAAGFLSVGPKMIADDDPKKKKMDIIDEQLSTLSQTFMALTMGCARCHDHKFDPIPTWDYYAMAGILQSTRTMEHLRVVAPVSLHEVKPAGYDQAMAAYNARRIELVAQRDQFWQQVAGEAWEAQQAKQQANQPETQPAKPDSSVEKQNKPFSLPQQADQYVPEEHKNQWQRLNSALAEHEATVPQKIHVMAPTDGEAQDLRVSLRGNYLTPGDLAKRQFLRIIDGEERRPLATQQSGRLELARWLTSPEHPLTARVMVNRIWRWRFGRGIVATPDNFGQLGARPSHPELLDWLAIKFVEDGWSIKQLHRRMLLSSTYQMSTQYDERSATVDPQNQWWWRFPRKRLEAEAIRDSVLAVSNRLDLTMGGSLMPLKDRSYVTGTASKQQKYDNPRRSLYQPVYRSAVYDVLTTFDFPDPATPNGDRNNSTIAPQALLMMNSDLVASAAQRISAGLLADGETDEQRLGWLYRRVLARDPTPAELETIGGYIRQAEVARGASAATSRQQVWEGICRILLSSNEFLYLD